MTPLKQSLELGLALCRTCGLAVSRASLRIDRRCPRCQSRVEHRTPFSTELTLAWLIAGIVFYIPANLLPVMHTSGLMGESDSTIIGGILEFWRSGDWDIALLIFTASIAVPFTKFIAIGLLLLTVRQNSRWRQYQRTALYRIVEFIGYWSMLDVIVVALTSALMQFQVLGAAEPRAGIAFFCGVVVVTMLSALSFDPRLIWDRRA
ncbi:MAG: paraquat-inducible protein [Gammaproteobacteria bacterium]|jgi:paraquat-inducible protein A|nr:paraquat-inducible protein [Gammaproteobacteria bacterium]MEA3138565.1 paraquat-inducible protein [Gammaproteobacteria bacterium]